MTEKIIADWKKTLLEVKENSRKQSNINVFKGIHRDQAIRASYFTEIAKVLERLGLSNPHESSSLSLEPTHPVQSQHLERAFDNLKINSLLKKTYRDSKLSLISLEMLSRYAPNSDAIKMIARGHTSPLYLLDPLYGFVFLPGENRIHNHCFAIDIWSSHLKSMPLKLSQELWNNRADSMLSGGAFAGRLLFRDVIPFEEDPLKRSSVPFISVNSEAELTHIMDILKNSIEDDPRIELWFRGQNKDYQTPERSSLIEIGVTPYSNVRDSDFTPSLYRKYDCFTDSIDKYEELVIELAEWVHYANSIISIKNENSGEKQISGVAVVDEIGLGSYQRGLLLQQYGAPSAYLDITRNHSIAAWFATRKCNIEEGKMVYSEHLWGGSNLDHWPTIYVFPLIKGLHPYLDLKSILKNSGAERPKRQMCGLLGGAGNLARNYCARYLGLKIRLGPEFKISSPFRAEYLFPSHSEDEVFRTLKESKLTYGSKNFPLSELA